MKQQGYTMHSLDPRNTFRHCQVCGSASSIDGAKSTCSNNTCKVVSYINPSPAVQALLINHRDEILFVTRHMEPAIGLLDLPGGFIDLGENVEAALKRELFEELGVKENLDLEYLMSDTDTYLYGGVNVPVLVMTFIAHVDYLDVDIRDEREIKSYQWIPLNEVEIDKLAFVNTKNVYSEIQKRL